MSILPPLPLLCKVHMGININCKLESIEKPDADAIWVHLEPVGHVAVRIDSEGI